MNLDLDTAIADVEPQCAAYVLLAADGAYLYKGSCRNLCERLKDHRAGRASHTKNRRPLRLVHFEYFASYSEALAREKYFKTGTGRDWLRAHIV
jgi:putative endonuclease